MLRRLSVEIESYREEAIELQRSLVAIPAISPDLGGEGEYDKVEFLTEYLEDTCLFDELTVLDVFDDRAKNGVRPNLLALYEGESSEMTIWFIVHTDVFPAGDRSLWRSDPFELSVEGNRIFGRGVEDNHQGICSSILAMQALMNLGLRPPHDVALLFIADEESGNMYGLISIIRSSTDLIRQTDCVLIPDGGNPYGTLVQIADRSLLSLRFKIEGKTDSSEPTLKGSKIRKAKSDLLTRLDTLYRRFPRRDRSFFPPMSTFEPSRREPYFVQVDAAPEDDAFFLNCQVLPSYHLYQVKAAARRICSDVEMTHGVTITLESCLEVQARSPSPLVLSAARALAKAIRRVYGVQVTPMGVSWMTTAAMLRSIGIPVIVYSKLEGTAHQPNECCVVDNLLGDAKVFANFVLNCPSNLGSREPVEPTPQ